MSEKILIAYFSHKGENYFGGKIKKIEKGNTEVVAEYIRDAVGGTLFEIVPKQAYPENYYACTDVAKRELQANSRPELKETLKSNDFDVLYLGFPNWWGTMPMVVWTFLESIDVSGKTIRPFCTNEGSGMGVSVRDLKKLCKSAVVKDGLSLRGSDVYSSRAELENWIKRG